MGGENIWFCIFEADLGCMVTKASGFTRFSLRLNASNLQQLRQHFLTNKQVGKAVSARTGQKNSAQLMTTHTKRLTTHFLPQA
jgi:hypothetical protein